MSKYITAEQANAFMEKSLAQKRIDLADLEMFVPDGGCVCVCYDTAEIYSSRKAAAASFMEAMYNSEGAENERYQNIFFDILEGKDICLDGVSEYVYKIERRF